MRSLNMRPLQLRTRCVAMAAAFAAVLSASGQAANANPLDGYALDWSDEFDGASISPLIWENLTRRDSFNNELQYYLPEQAGLTTVADPDTGESRDVLRITATDEPIGGKPYRSARLESRQQAGFDFQYGRVEVLAKIPTTKGIWPAIWLFPRDVPWPSGGEIDIMEHGGSRPGVVSSAYHYNTQFPSSFRYHEYDEDAVTGQPVQWPEGFHLYAVERDEHEIRYYVNGYNHFTVVSDDAPSAYKPDQGEAGDTQRHTLTDNPMSVILNTAVGGFFDGNPDGTTVFPQHFDIDYVRVYERTETGPRVENGGFTFGDSGWQALNTATFEPSSQDDPALRLQDNGLVRQFLWGTEPGVSYRYSFDFLDQTSLGSQVAIDLLFAGEDNAVLGSSSESFVFDAESPTEFVDVTAPGGTVFTRVTLRGVGLTDAWVDNFAVTAPIAGDYNGDGVVDAADFTVFRDTLGSTTDLAADGDGDGVVWIGDYVVWATEFGERAARARDPRAGRRLAGCVVCCLPGDEDTPTVNGRAQAIATKLLVASVGLFFAVSTKGENPPPPTGWRFVWGDDFDDPAGRLDEARWTRVDTVRPTNDSRHAYLPELATVEDGRLVLTSRDEPYEHLPFRSGAVHTKASWKHGRFEIRAKLPTTRGMWPAIWLLADPHKHQWPSGGEIDIMENRGDEPTKTSSAFHFGTNPPYKHRFVDSEQQTRHGGQLVSYPAGLHTYAVEWTPTLLRFFVDDVCHYTVADDDVDGFLSGPIEPMQLWINTAIGGWFLKNPDETTVWPQRFEVDWVRVYQRDPAEPLATELRNGGFDEVGGSLAGWTTFGVGVPDNPNALATSDVAHEGAASLKLFGRFEPHVRRTGVSQGITVQPGQLVEAVAHALTPGSDSLAGTSNRVRLQLEFYDEFGAKRGDSPPPGSAGKLIAGAATTPDVWERSKISARVPDGAVEARVAIVFNQPKLEPGSVRVDNVALRVVGPE